MTLTHLLRIRNATLSLTESCQLLLVVKPPTSQLDRGQGRMRNGDKWSQQPTATPSNDCDARGARITLAGLLGTGTFRWSEPRAALTHALAASPQTAWAALTQCDEGLDWKDAVQCASVHLEALLMGSLIDITGNGMCVRPFRA